MPAAGYQRHRRILDVDTDQRGADMALQMMDTDERNVLGKTQGLRVGKPDQQAPNQTGSVSDRDRVEVIEANIGLGQRFAHNWHDGSNMFAASQLRHDATIFLVDIELRRYAGR